MVSILILLAHLQQLVLLVMVIYNSQVLSYLMGMQEQMAIILEVKVRVLLLFGNLLRLVKFIRELGMRILILLH